MTSMSVVLYLLIYDIIHDTMSLRSKTFDNSLLSHVTPDTEAKVEQKKPHYSQVRGSGHQGAFIDINFVDRCNVILSSSLSAFQDQLTVS